MSAEMVKAKLNGRYSIILPEHRAKREEWYRPEGWEKIRLEAMEKAIKATKGSVVYYVGAEEGEMPALCQMWGAEVAMFEPNPKVWPNIKAIWDANKLMPPLLNFVGFAANTDEFEGKGENLYTRAWPPCASGEVIGDHGFMNLSEVDNATTGQIKIDHVVGTLGVKPPTLLTMDVEGSEWEVLRGAEHTLREHRPDIFLSLHPEFMYEMYHEYGFDCRHWIKGLGYKETILDYQHEVHILYEAIK